MPSTRFGLRRWFEREVSAPLTAMLRNAFGTLNGWEAAVVIVELFLLSAVVLQLAVRLFRYGSIQYTSRVSLKTVFARTRLEAAPTRS